MRVFRLALSTLLIVISIFGFAQVCVWAGTSILVHQSELQQEDVHFSVEQFPTLLADSKGRTIYAVVIIKTGDADTFLSGHSWGMLPPPPDMLEVPEDFLEDF
jgi:hypothetical protein